LRHSGLDVTIIDRRNHHIFQPLLYQVATAVGDSAIVIQNGRPLPGVAQAAIQQGRYVGGWIAGEIGGGKPPRPFRYFDKGNMAVIGKNFAVMESGRIKLAGIIPWFIWAFIHIMFLPQLQNQWFWSYFTGQRSSRLVDEPPRI
jgi:NADH dehydrogenase